MDNQPSPIPLAATIPIGYKIVSLLFYIAAIIFIMQGMVLAYDIFFRPSAELSLGILSIAFGSACFYGGKGLWAGMQWGRLLAIVLSGLYFVYSIINLLLSGPPNWIAPCIFLLAILVMVLYLIFSKPIAT